jgi:hypothetical protein
MGDDHMLAIGAAKRPLKATLFEALHHPNRGFSND